MYQYEQLLRVYLHCSSLYCSYFCGVEIYLLHQIYIKFVNIFWRARRRNLVVSRNSIRYTNFARSVSAHLYKFTHKRSNRYCNFVRKWRQTIVIVNIFMQKKIISGIILHCSLAFDNHKSKTELVHHKLDSAVSYQAHKYIIYSATVLLLTYEYE